MRSRRRRLIVEAIGGRHCDGCNGKIFLTLRDHLLFDIRFEEFVILRHCSHRGISTVCTNYDSTEYGSILIGESVSSAGGTTSVD